MYVVYLRITSFRYNVLIDTRDINTCGILYYYSSSSVYIISHINHQHQKV